MLRTAPPSANALEMSAPQLTKRTADMTKLHTSIAAASLLVLAGLAQAQQAPDANKPNPSAATTTGTSTSQAEMNKGVPAVNVDVGKNSKNGVVSADVDKNTDAANVTNRTNASGTTSTTTTNTDSASGTRAARSDRG
jgi:hypothetical protein